MRTEVCARTSSRSSEALTSSPISERVARTSLETSGCSAVACVCGFDSVASMNASSITGDFGAEGEAKVCLSFHFGLATRTQAHNADIREIAIALIKIEAVADHEFVGDDEAGVIGFDIGDAALNFVEEHGDAQVFGLALFEQAQQVFQRQAGIEDVFHHKDRTPFNAHVEVLDHFHFTGRVHAFAVARNRNEVKGDFAAEFPGEIRQEKYGAF